MSFENVKIQLKLDLNCINCEVLNFSVQLIIVDYDILQNYNFIRTFIVNKEFLEKFYIILLKIY